jgi:hypothetical protein
MDQITDQWRALVKIMITLTGFLEGGQFLDWLSEYYILNSCAPVS